MGEAAARRLVRCEATTDLDAVASSGVISSKMIWKEFKKPRQQAYHSCRCLAPAASAYTLLATFVAANLIQSGGLMSLCLAGHSYFLFNRAANVVASDRALLR